MAESAIPEPDWTTFDQWDPSEILCRCDTTYYSHSKTLLHEGAVVHLTRKPCPGCGSRTSPVRARSATERWTIE